MSDSEEQKEQEEQNGNDEGAENDPSEEPGKQEPATEDEESLPSQPESDEEFTFVEIPLEKYQDLQESAQERDEYLEQLRKVSADYDNYQKRMRRKRKEDKKFATRDIISDLLPVLDDFDHALPENSDQDDDLVQGMFMIYEKLLGTLEEKGVEQIEETGIPFDPNVHEGVTMVETEEVEQETVQEVLRKGYKLNEQVLRPARVVIARPPSEDDTDE